MDSFWSGFLLCWSSGLLGEISFSLARLFVLSAVCSAFRFAVCLFSGDCVPSVSVLFVSLTAETMSLEGRPEPKGAGSAGVQTGGSGSQ